MTDRMLLKGGHVLTMDRDLGDLVGDVLIEDGKIAAVGADLGVEDAEVVDVTGDIVIPGFVDSHRHTWETAIRGCAPNATLDDYFVEVLDSFAPLYRPEDVHASNLWGSLECINAGITTLLDWSHINNTPDHPDAAVAGLSESGIRAVYAYGSANTSLAAYWFNSELAIPDDDVTRLRDTYFAGDGGLLTMALATRGPGFTQDQVVRAEWELARRLGIPITIHVAMGRLAGRFGMVKQLSDLGLLGPDTTYVHSCYLSDEEWRLVADTGGTVSVAAQVETQMGHGAPPTARAIAEGLRPSLSIDVVTTVPGDMFTQIHAAFAADREKVNAECWKADVEIPDTMLTARQMLEIATSNGAHVVGLEDRTGSLTPGKEADVIVIDGSAVNVAPVIDPVAAVTLGADVSNVDTVIIGGTVHKRDGRLTADLSGPRRLIEASKEYLVDELARRQSEAGTAARTDAGVTGRHLVRWASEAVYSTPEVFMGRSEGFSRWSCVGDDDAAAAHTDFGVCVLAPGGRVDRHVHSYEESFHVLDGAMVCATAEGAVRLVAGDYGLIPIGVPHGWRNLDGGPVRWAHFNNPQPRTRNNRDTYFLPETVRPDDLLTIDVRDPRNRSFGHIDPENMDPAEQTQDRLAVSASMRTALLVYSGITLKMMVDTDLGAQLGTMFMVQYEPGGFAGAHDHPLEEAYLVIDGEVEAVFDGERYTLQAGDFGFCGVGSVHEFANTTDSTVRWLETQAPGPPARHAYRFVRDWTYLEAQLD